jgi:cation diffusion facilitator family transporter
MNTVDKTTMSWRDVPHLRFIMLSVAAAIATVVLKFAAYRATGSVGLLSDAVESTVNVAAALTALYALWYAAHPADRSHPYGHEKIEFFSSGVEGGLILVAAVSIAWTAVLRLQNPAPLQSLDAGVALALLAAAINFGVARALLREGRRADSIILEADGHHLMSDVWTSLGVVAGLLLAWWTQVPWVDPLLALAVAVNIVRIGYDLMRRSFDGLMDRALDDAEVAKIRTAIERAMEEIEGDGDRHLTYHALRTRRAGSRRFVDYHLLVPGDCPVRRAHDCEMIIGRAIENAIPGVEVTSHIEPLEEPMAWNDVRWQEESHPAVLRSGGL